MARYSINLGNRLPTCQRSAEFSHGPRQKYAQAHELLPMSLTKRCLPFRRWQLHMIGGHAAGTDSYGAEHQLSTANISAHFTNLGSLRLDYRFIIGPAQRAAEVHELDMTGWPADQGQAVPGQLASLTLWLGKYRRVDVSKCSASLARP